jgi:hypothetical protein
MVEQIHAFSEAAVERVIEQVKRDRRRPRNGVQQWRARRVSRSGVKEIAWAMIPPGDNVLYTPVADCMIASTPDGTYGDLTFTYAEVGGFFTYCAGLFPGQWYPIHAGTNYFLTPGSWFLSGVADTGCDIDGEFTLKINLAQSPFEDFVYVPECHSPFGSIEAGASVYVGWRGGQGGYVAILDSCTP